MVFSRFSLRLRLTAVLAAGATALVFSAAAQGSDQSDQPIIFSKPADSGGIGAVPQVSDSAPQAFDHSAPNFFNSNPDAPLPMPNHAWQKTLDNRRNWMLMTPEEIMGVESPEKMFGLPEKDPDKNLPLDERFLKRQENSAMAAASNSLNANNIFSRRDNGLLDQSKNSDLFSQPNSGIDLGPGKNLDTSFNRASQSSPFDQKVNSIWTSAFGKPPAPVKMDPEQVAAMERFRALIGERETEQNSTAALPQAPTPTPSLQPAAQFDPFGHPVASAASDLSKPSSLSALPQLAGSYLPTAPVKRPAWKPQPPPWLSDNSLPANGPPVRKF